MDVAVDPVDPRVVYAASADGGAWRLDANSTYTSYAWTPLLDDADNLSILAVAVSPASHTVVFIADTGNRVLRSTNGGKAWTPMQHFIVKSQVIEPDHQVRSLKFFDEIMHLRLPIDSVFRPRGVIRHSDTHPHSADFVPTAYFIG